MTLLNTFVAPTPTAAPESFAPDSTGRGTGARGAGAPTSVIAARFNLTDADLEAFGAELDAIRAEVLADLGERDRDYILGIVATQRRLEILGRVSLLASSFPPAWLIGTAALSLSKILDNMEIGHNVMHGQYDWMNDPVVDSRTFEWDNVAPSEQWQHSHNYLHHTFTNIEGVDRDLGYALVRVTDRQPWHPVYLANPLLAAGLAFLFEYGVMAHDLEFDRLIRRERPFSEVKPLLKRQGQKIRRQALKDYVLFPALTGPQFVTTLAANATANVVRNLWAFSVIFCGHFPEGVETFERDAMDDESRGAWYLRQILGSANFTGSPLMHIMSGNLSHQIEHHLFPDLPAHRYAELSPRVQEICARYGVPYNSGSFPKQFGSVIKKLFRLALP
jgi:linoleoyl-CoA desaturase